MRLKTYADGEPCGHPGCLHHATHPCEGCGRIAGVRIRPTTTVLINTFKDGFRTMTVGGVEYEIVSRRRIVLQAESDKLPVEVVEFKVRRLEK